MGNLVFLISFYLNHLLIEHTLSSVNVCSCVTRLVCFRNLNVFYLVLRIPYLYMMHYGQSHSHCPLTSPSHSWWLPTFVSFFFLCCFCCIPDSSSHSICKRKDFIPSFLFLCILWAFQPLFYDVSQRQKNGIDVSPRYEHITIYFRTLASHSSWLWSLPIAKNI